MPTPSFPLGGGEFSLHPARALPLRILTIGVLIVSGGVLAALPFRRYQAIPYASSAPLQVTGPAQSALDSPQLDGVESGSLAGGELDPTKACAEFMAVAARQPWDKAAISPERRSVDIPLTYEDLATPIDLPAAIRRRFNATAPVREKELERQRVAELVMPAMESLAVSQRQELERAKIAATSESGSRKATGTLASAPSERNTQRLPEASTDQRTRHWIRQPD